MSPRRQSPLSLEYVLLGLVDQNPIHGYDLYKKIVSAEGVSLVWQIKQSQLYALLEKLEAEGLLTSSLVAGEAFPLRKEYRTTNLGRQSFYAWMTSPVEHMRDVRQEFMARLYFALKVGSNLALELIEGQIHASTEWLHGMQDAYTALESERQYERMVYRFRIAQTEALLAWLASCRKELA